MAELLAFDAALAKAIAAAPALSTEDVPLVEAVGRTLAEAVRADLDTPPFDTTAMDGWAVAADTLPADGRLRIVATVAAGQELGASRHPSDAAASEPVAVKLMTGAPLPDGYDTVVPVEEAEELPGGWVRIHTTPRRRDHIRARGEIWKTGAQLLAPGVRLSAAGIALAAAAGRERLAVVRRARAGVLVTGDEVVPPGAAPGPSQIRNTNGPLLLSALRRLGADAKDLGIAKDSREALSAALRNALGRGFDFLLTTGGVSAGDFDLVTPLLAELGAETLFHKIALKPAKPLLLARHGSTLIFALPGNPVSCAVAFDFFVRSVWRRSNGIAPATPEPVTATLCESVRNRGPRLALHPADIRFEDGRLIARPLAPKGSHDLFTHARASALLRLAPDSSFEAGAVVPAYLATEETTLA